jgi:hypothetical protein
MQFLILITNQSRKFAIQAIKNFRIENPTQCKNFSLISQTWQETWNNKHGAHIKKNKNLNKGSKWVVKNQKKEEAYKKEKNLRCLWREYKRWRRKERRGSQTQLV